MKTWLISLAVLTMLLASKSAWAQNQAEGTAIRTYLGYMALMNPASGLADGTIHAGPAIMLSLPGLSKKIRVLAGGSSLAGGVFGGLEYSSLLTDPAASVRARLTGGVAYSFSKVFVNDVPERHRFISLYLGVSGLFDLTRNLALELTVAPALMNEVSFPAALVKVEHSSLGMLLRCSVKVPI